MPILHKKYSQFLPYFESIAVKKTLSLQYPGRVVTCCDFTAAAKDAAAAAAAQKEREERIRGLKERQGEERQRKLDELKQQVSVLQV